jgi:hypothetical protein
VEPGGIVTEMAFHGTVDAGYLPTSYHFEYYATTGYGTSVPVPDATAGSGGTPVPVTQQISGLRQGTYHFRLVASNAAGTTASRDAGFMVGLPPGAVTPGGPHLAPQRPPA